MIMYVVMYQLLSRPSDCH